MSKIDPKLNSFQNSNIISLSQLSHQIKKSTNTVIRSFCSNFNFRNINNLKDNSIRNYYESPNIISSFNSYNNKSINIIIPSFIKRVKINDSLISDSPIKEIHVIKDHILLLHDTGLITLFNIINYSIREINYFSNNIIKAQSIIVECHDSSESYFSYKINNNKYTSIVDSLLKCENEHKVYYDTQNSRKLNYGTNSFTSNYNTNRDYKENRDLSTNKINSNNIEKTYFFVICLITESSNNNNNNIKTNTQKLKCYLVDLDFLFSLDKETESAENNDFEDINNNDLNNFPQLTQLTNLNKSQYYFNYPSQKSQSSYYKAKSNLEMKFSQCEVIREIKEKEEELNSNASSSNRSNHNIKKGKNHNREKYLPANKEIKDDELIIIDVFPNEHFYVSSFIEFDDMNNRIITRDSMMTYKIWKFDYLKIRELFIRNYNEEIAKEDKEHIRNVNKTVKVADSQLSQKYINNSNTHNSYINSNYSLLSRDNIKKSLDKNSCLNSINIISIQSNNANNNKNTRNTDFIYSIKTKYYSFLQNNSNIILKQTFSLSQREISEIRITKDILISLSITQEEETQLILTLYNIYSGVVLHSYQFHFNPLYSFEFFEIINTNLLLKQESKPAVLINLLNTDEFRPLKNELLIDNSRIIVLEKINHAIIISQYKLVFIDCQDGTVRRIINTLCEINLNNVVVCKKKEVLVLYLKNRKNNIYDKDKDNESNGEYEYSDNIKEANNNANNKNNSIGSNYGDIISYIENENNDDYESNDSNESNEGNDSSRYIKTESKFATNIKDIKTNNFLNINFTSESKMTSNDKSKANRDSRDNRDRSYKSIKFLNNYDYDFNYTENKSHIKAEPKILLDELSTIKKNISCAKININENNYTLGDFSNIKTKIKNNNNILLESVLDYTDSIDSNIESNNNIEKQIKQNKCCLDSKNFILDTNTKIKKQDNNINSINNNIYNSSIKKSQLKSSKRYYNKDEVSQLSNKNNKGNTDDSNTNNTNNNITNKVKDKKKAIKNKDKKKFNKILDNLNNTNTIINANTITNTNNNKKNNYNYITRTPPTIKKIKHKIIKKKDDYNDFLYGEFEVIDISNTYFKTVKKINTLNSKVIIDHSNIKNVGEVNNKSSSLIKNHISTFNVYDKNNKGGKNNYGNDNDDEICNTKKGKSDITHYAYFPVINELIGITTNKEFVTISGI